MSSRILVKVLPMGRVQVVENGQLDLTTLGSVRMRKRLGAIEPLPDALAYLGVTMLNTTPPTSLPGRYKTKGAAVDAETDAARQILLQTADDSKPDKVKKRRRRKKADEGRNIVPTKEDRSLPVTGSCVVRCPLCRHPLVPAVITTGQIGAPDATASVFLCGCPGTGLRP